jgi:phytoene synthase
MSMLDEALINRAAPPGSMRYFSLLYAPPALRSALTALLVIEAEIRESAYSVNHDVAHTRLGWWRMEVERLIHGSAQHPATRVLLSAAVPQPDCWNLLHELLSAADMDLGRLTYDTMEQLNAYCARSGGAVQELAALQLLAPSIADTTLRSVANRIGGALRQVEILRDVRLDCRAGRLYLPLHILQRHGIALVDLLQPQFSPATQAALQEYCAAVLQRLDAAIAGLTRAVHARLRPLLVMVALHRRLLLRMAAAVGRLASERIELGPIEKPWVAWRAATRAR